MSESAVRNAASFLKSNWLSIYDFDTIRHQKRPPQQAPQHSDRVEHWSFAAAADFHVDDVARLLYGQGERGIDAPAGDAAPRVSNVRLAGLLPRENPCCARSGSDRALFVVWRPI